MTRATERDGAAGRWAAELLHLLHLLWLRQGCWPCEPRSPCAEPAASLALVIIGPLLLLFLPHGFSGAPLNLLNPDVKCPPEPTWQAGTVHCLAGLTENYKRCIFSKERLFQIISDGRTTIQMIIRCNNSDYSPDYSFYRCASVGETPTPTCILAFSALLSAH